MQAEIVKNLTEKLKAYYVFPDFAEQICLRLQRYLEQEHTRVLPRANFCLCFNTHMQEVNHDEHLWVRWHAQAVARRRRPLRLNQEWQDERRLEAKLDNLWVSQSGEAARKRGNHRYSLISAGPNGGAMPLPRR